jgi:antitoxin CptB
MDETPTPAALDNRRRRLLFRANHRGTKETDVLVGGYVSARIGAFDDAALDQLERIMDLPDPELADWLTGRLPIPAGHQQAVMLQAMFLAARV